MNKELRKRVILGTLTNEDYTQLRKEENEDIFEKIIDSLPQDRYEDLVKKLSNYKNTNNGKSETNRKLEGSSFR